VAWFKRPEPYEKRDEKIVRVNSVQWEIGVNEYVYEYGWRGHSYSYTYSYTQISAKQRRTSKMEERL